MMKTSLFALSAALVLAAAAAPAAAAVETFDGPVATGATQAPGVWYTDRYAPAGFEGGVVFGGDERLRQTISENDGAVDRPGAFSSSFYNTQGRKFDLGSVESMSIDLFVDASWETTGRRMAGFWGEGFDGTSLQSYPILSFTSEGGVGRFQAWDGAAYVDLLGGFSYGDWTTLGVSLSGGNYVYSVGTQSLSVSANGATSINTVILQGHNNTAGVSYDIYWDNLATPAVPEPATWAMMIAGFGFVGGSLRMRNRKLAVA